MLAARLARRAALAPKHTSVAAAASIAAPKPCAAHTLRRSFASGYGDPEQTGDRASNNPLQQNAEARNDTEHPGPEPVAEGKGSGAAGKTSKPDGGASSSSNIRSQTQAAGSGAEVDKHNRELDQRYGQKKEGDEHVEKGYWSGHGGRDREP